MSVSRACALNYLVKSVFLFYIFPENIYLFHYFMGLEKTHGVSPSYFRLDRDSHTLRDKAKQQNCDW